VYAVTFVFAKIERSTAKTYFLLFNASIRASTMLIFFSMADKLSANPFCNEHNNSLLERRSLVIDTADDSISFNRSAKCAAETWTSASALSRRTKLGNSSATDSIF